MQHHEYVGPMALRAMQSLAVRVFPATGYRHIGDLTWNWCLSPDRGEATAPAAVWTRDGRTAAWGWLDPPDGLLLQTDPGHPELADEVLAWAVRTAGHAAARTAAHTAGGPLTVEAAGTESHLIAALDRAGCVRAADGPFMMCLGRPLTDLPDVPRLPDGYTIRVQHDRTDVAGRARAHRLAFGSTRVTTERHARMRETWPYRAEFDLVVTAPAGEVVAYCQGWYDEVNRTGAFEPVGTRPGHRRLGLARAVCTAVLHAFAAAGGRRAIVYCRGDAAYPLPRRLYISLGFTPYTRTYTYRHPGPPTG
ncbi:GNAT family N-acetyltransferase [Streptomyces sp. MST-110588]|uniref:GNAT family N-acetyltransferase n=1 Tax=Streptomyces sp. MST-110588 TaxID=2833628 RepID=UPI001F5C548A|nr:GNAT family N-acetyltransferase [Streptomyces sp. MST-110588]UNO43509.1 GNAT family N-acetyltransferase [Streptomyces sp. MST-110588]